MSNKKQETTIMGFACCQIHFFLRIRELIFLMAKMLTGVTCFPQLKKQLNSEASIIRKF